ncbi:hypothetical protein PGB90_010574 [Kerria lacca]
MEENKDITIVDFRSDTLSLPTNEMRQAIYEAKVGDNIFGEDPSVNELEKKCAELFKKEAACYVSSGTMGNLTAILIHCEKRSSEIIAGSESHILLFEQTGVAQFGGINIREIENKPDGTFDINVLKTKIREDDCHMPITRLICVENTHNMLGGKVLPQKWLTSLKEFAKSVNIPLHMDGARIFNAAVKLKIPVSEITDGIDSICFCLSKSLGAPYGSVLLGSEEFIHKARRIVKGLGGGVRQIGFMAAAGLYSLENMVHRLKDDHDHIQKIANAIRDMKNPNFTVPKAEDIHTNILFIGLNTSKIVSEDFLKKLNTISEEETHPVIVKGLSIHVEKLRLVVCCNNSASDVDHAIRKIQQVINEFK